MTQGIRWPRDGRRRYDENSTSGASPMSSSLSSSRRVPFATNVGWRDNEPLPVEPLALRGTRNKFVSMDSKDVFVPAPVKPAVSFFLLEALDIRLGTIQAVDDVPASRKLLRLTVGFGDHTRRILAGMKHERSDPGQLVGRQALFVVNLEPKPMAGQVSEGMLLDIGYADGLTPALAVPERSLPDGVRAG